MKLSTPLPLPQYNLAVHLLETLLLFPVHLCCTELCSCEQSEPSHLQLSKTNLLAESCSLRRDLEEKTHRYSSGSFSLDFSNGLFNCTIQSTTSSISISSTESVGNASSKIFIRWFNTFEAIFGIISCTFIYVGERKAPPSSLSAQFNFFSDASSLM